MALVIVDNRYAYFKRCLLLTFCISSLCLYAQDAHYMDSLKKTISSAKDTRVKIDALNAFAYEFRNTNIDSGIQIAKQAYELSKPLQYHNGMGDYYDCIGSFLFSDSPDTAIKLFYMAIAEFSIDRNYHKLMNEEANLGNVFLAAGEYDSAIRHTRVALSYVDHNNEMDGQAKQRSRMWQFQTLGTIFYYQSYYDSSTIYCQKALAIAEAQGDKNAVSLALTTIGNVYAQQKDYLKAIEYQKKALAFDTELQYHRNRILKLTDIADNYVYLKDYFEAKRYTDSAFSEGAKYGIAKYVPHNYRTYGDIAMAGQDCRAALEYYNKGLKCCTNSPNPFVESGLLQSKGEAYLCLGKPADAISAFLSALKKCEDDRETKQLCYEGLGNAYEKAGNNNEALHYLRLSVALKDSIFNDETRETINSLNIKYETVKKEQRIQSLASENEAKSNRARQEQTKKNFAYLAIATLLSFGSYSFYRFRRQKKIENEQALLKERLRISRDLHDDMGATLSSISVYCSAVKQRLQSGKTADAAQMLDTISEDARTMVSNMSDMVWMISPENNTVQKVFDRTQLFASNVLAAKDIALHFSVDERVSRLELTIEARKNIFLISKEAINNAVKYSGGVNIYIEVRKEENNMVIEVRDDGKGFECEKEQTGNGLKNMKQRTEELGGSCRFVSAPGLGARLVFSFSIPKIGDV